ncbi:chalcone--flavonone isomerase [Ananas comosus]|uniref:Chalcone-flavonone isomerase family protein n=1 Tax=Ananas comosus TaxID=4615 RepID=A0A6P5G2D6_ANACO|nr:chalcone--flavonone isomerase [Ananas comosus]
MAEAPIVVVPKLEIEGVTFPAVTSPPRSSSSSPLFLAGAGPRGLEIGGRFVNFTAIGVYLEEGALRSLAGKWGGAAAEELAGDEHFYRDIVAGPFEKFTRVTMLLPLTGQQYSEKVAENCLAHWKAAGVYTEAEGAAVDKFKEAFKAETFPPGSSILFTHSPSSSLTIAFSSDSSVPEVGNVVIENRALCEAILESIIGEHGVSPATKRSLALRVSELLKEFGGAKEAEVEKPVEVST